MIKLEKIKLFDWEMAVPAHSKQSITKLLTEMSNPMLLKHSIVEVDEEGMLCGFIPQEGLTWDAIFFMQNLMIEQRLALMDKVIMENK